jgi:hypothetical protein
VKGFTDWLVWAYAWVKDHDLPNVFTVILWPLVLFWWATRKVNNVSNLLVSFTPLPDGIVVGKRYPAVAIFFENQTGSIVYINGPRIKDCSTLVQIPTVAVRDIGENLHPLAFHNGKTGIYEDHQITLQTGSKTQTAIAVTTEMQESFYRYKPSFFRRIFRRPKYFILEYTAMVGEKNIRS